MNPLVLGESCSVYFYEALAVLGIDDETSRDEARRAYLRLLKQHKPERDPEGFKRVREAYDLVRDSLPEVVIPRPRVEEPEEEEEAPPKPEEEPTTPKPEEEPTPPKPEEEPTPPISEAREPLPDWWSLYRRAEEAETTAQWPRVFEALELAAKHVDAPEPPITATLHMMLRCIRDDEREGFHYLFKALGEWTVASGMEARAFRGERVVLWTVIRELGDVGKDLPIAVTRAITSAMLEGALANAKADLEVYTLAFPERALAASSVLLHGAPYLHRTIGPMLQPRVTNPTRFERAPEPAREETLPWHKFIYPLLIVMMFLVRMCTVTERPSAPTFDSSRFKFTVPPPMPSLFFPKPEPPALLWARILKDDPLNQGEPTLRVAANAVWIKIQLNDCVGAREALNKYAIVLAGSHAGPDDKRRIYTEQIDKDLTEMCTKPDGGVDAQGADR